MNNINILRYVHGATTQDDQPAGSFHDWARRWMTADQSHISPNQENGEDCGMFTIITTTLMLMTQGCCIRPNTYTQTTIDTKQLR